MFIFKSSQFLSENFVRSHAIVYVICTCLALSFSACESRSAKADRELEALGYCFDEGRYLTDVEIYSAAIKDTLAKIENDESLPEDIQALAGLDVETFYELHPYCCTPVVDPNHRRKIGGDSNQRVAIRKLYGSLVYTVGIRFSTPIDNYRIITKIGRCGESVSPSFNLRRSEGTSLDRQKSGFPNRSHKFVIKMGRR